MTDPRKPDPATPPAVPAPLAKLEVDPAILAPSLARDLVRLPKELWGEIEAVRCQVDFTRDMAEGIRFVDTVANVVNQRGGLFTATDPKRRRELEEQSDRIVGAFRQFIVTTVEVARKIRLTYILQRNWRLLSIYGPLPGGTEKSPAPKKDAQAANVA